MGKNQGMTEILKNFEAIALEMPSIMVIIGGVVCVGVGVCVWLGGLRWRIFTAVIFGLTVGFVSSFFVSENRLIAAIFPTILVTCSLLIFRKRALVVIGAITTTTVLVLSLASPVSAQTSYRPGMKAALHTEQKIDLDAVISQLSSQSDITGFQIPTLIGDLTPSAIGIAAVSGSLVMGLGLFLHKLVSAGTCAAYGTGLIYAGMILLLLEKGSMPVEHICRKPVFYQTVAICMLIFGTFVGVLVCPVKKKKTVQVKDDVGEEK